MSAKDMFINLDYTYKEDKSYAYIYDKEQLYFQLDKDITEPIINIYAKGCEAILNIDDLRAINKFYQELGINILEEVE